MAEKYCDYFNIDPDYFPQVNEAIINKEPDLWKKFYPHESFVGLIRDTISVVTRKQKVSIWVEGAYGTGKSHAVLTLKKLLDASQEETKEYFEKYDAPARERIVDGFKWCFPEGSIFREILSIGPAGMDPDILRICQFVGERLPKDKAPGAAAGAGSGGSKSISDSFMGL